jgi:UDP-glucose 4-epimerase
LVPLCAVIVAAEREKIKNILFSLSAATITAHKGTNIFELHPVSKSITKYNEPYSLVPLCAVIVAAEREKIKNILK